MDSDYLSNIFYQGGVQYVDYSTVAFFVAALVLLWVSSFISAAEVAFFSLTAAEKSGLHEEERPKDEVILQLLEHPDELRASFLIADTWINLTIVLLVVCGMGCLPDFAPVSGLGLALELGALILMILLFGEIMPKAYAQKDRLRMVRRSASLVWWIDLLCSPLSRLSVAAFRSVSRMMGRKKRDISVDELSKALELTSKAIPEEKAMLAEIIKFYNKTADGIMTSRLDMEDIDIDSSFHAVVQKIIQCGYSRIPVYKDSEDNIKGILYIKDLLPYLEKPDTFRWQSLIRPAYFVPETKKIDDLLEEFRTNKIHMAIVVDEFGGTSGIVTMEDILEEIVGDISDEYDEDEKPFIRLSDGSYIFEAKIPLTDFFRITGVKSGMFAEFAEDVETLGGLLLEIKGDFPKRREIIEQSGCRFQVLEVDNRRILKIKFNLIAKIPNENRKISEEKPAE